MNRRKFLKSASVVGVTALAGCGGVDRDKDLRIYDSGVEKYDEYVVAWADVENTKHPKGNPIAQVYLYIVNEDGEVLGPDVMTNPVLESRVTRTTLKWYPGNKSLIDEVAGVDPDIVGVYNAVMGSNNDGHQVVDNRGDYD